MATFSRRYLHAGRRKDGRIVQNCAPRSYRKGSKNLGAALGVLPNLTRRFSRRAGLSAYASLGRLTRPCGRSVPLMVNSVHPVQGRSLETWRRSLRRDSSVWRLGVIFMLSRNGIRFALSDRASIRSVDRGRAATVHFLLGKESSYGGGNWCCDGQWVDLGSGEHPGAGERCRAASGEPAGEPESGRECGGVPAETSVGCVSKR